MTKPLIALPCTAQEMENALHRVCDHDGLWEGYINISSDAKIGICLDIETETKGENHGA